MAMTAKLIRIEYKQGRSGLIFATSPDLHGLLCSERTMEELEPTISEAITQLCAASGEEVAAVKVDDQNAWVAVPTEVLRRGLEQMSAV